MVTSRKQGGDACSDLGSLDARNKHSCAEKSFFGFQEMKQGKKFLFMKYGIIWSHITFRIHTANSVLTGHHVQVISSPFDGYD